MNVRRFVLTTAGLLGVAVFLAITVALAQGAPELINYQGRLFDGSGQAVNGSVDLEFSIVDGDSALRWSETQNGVMVTQGIYNVMLGSANPLPASVLSGSTAYLQVRVNGEWLGPKQRIVSVGYALRCQEAGNADTLDGLDSTELMSGGDFYSKAEVDAMIAALQSQIDALQTQVSANTAGIGSLDTRVTDAEIALGDHDIMLWDHESRIVDLEAVSGASAGEKLAHITVSGTDFIISGVNVYIQNGAGSTETVNGLGNLIVGYNELRGSGDVRTGSHNIVAGSLQNYSSYGGLAAGYSNDLSGQYASILGGTGNVASGQYCAVLAGSSNVASGTGASVSGGKFNLASGDFSAVAGGGGVNALYGNEAYSHYSAILGGRSNDTGNGSNRNVGQSTTVSGGESNRASDTCASVSGGSSNTASGTYSSVCAGRANIASGQYAGVTGGESNTASNRSATVSGGQSRTAGGGYDWAAGSLWETQ